MISISHWGMFDVLPYGFMLTDDDGWIEQERIKLRNAYLREWCEMYRDK